MALVLLILFSNGLPLSAGQAARIYGEDLQVCEGTAWKIPVQIQDNPGIMGFRIHIEYPADKLAVLGIERGKVIEKGNFTDNVGQDQGNFDILWNGTAETKEDGVLFYVSAQLPEGMQDEFTLRLSYLKPDTFNEKWEDVVFECRNITVSVKENQMTDTQNPVSESGTESEITEIEVYEEERTISEFIEESNANLDSTWIVSLLKKELSKNSVHNMEDFIDEAGDEATERILDILEKEGIETAKVIKTYGKKRKLQALEGLYEMAGREKIAVEPEERNRTYAGILVLLLLSAAVFIVLVHVLHTRRKDR